MLAVVAIYCVVNVTLQVLVQPKFVSDAVNLSLTLSFFSVIFWTFIIGPLGRDPVDPAHAARARARARRATPTSDGCGGCRATPTVDAAGRSGAVTEEQWRQVTYWPLVIASLLFIVAYSWQVIADLQGTAETIARGFILVTWAVFVIDYLVRLWLSSPRACWFRHHIFDLLVVMLPALKPLPLLQALTNVPKRSSAGTALRSRISVYGAGAALVLIWVASLGDARRGARQAGCEHRDLR